MQKHKWYKEIVAWASGAEIEARTLSFGGTYTDWYRASSPLWDAGDVEYRIKPQPIEPQYLYVYMEPETGNYKFTNKIANIYKPFYIGKIKLEVDDD